MADWIVPNEKKLAALKVLEAYRNATVSQMHDFGLPVDPSIRTKQLADHQVREYSALQEKLNSINGHIRDFSKLEVTCAAAKAAAKTIQSLNDGIHLRVAGSNPAYSIKSTLQGLPAPMRETTLTAISSACREFNREIQPSSKSRLPASIGRDPRRPRG
jgi:hypothetical protein